MIRRMREEDLAAVAELEKECFTPCWSFDLLESGLFSNFDEYFVFEQDEQVLGYCNLRLIADEGEIERICVRPGFRGLGVGRMLMNEMINSAWWHGARGITLEVRESNDPARRLYEAFGFIEQGVRKNYYSDPVEDAIIMWKH